MKFISKMSNLRIVLRPGIQAQPITGTPAIPTLFVQFRDGVATVSDEELIEKMLVHQGINRQFVAVEEGEKAPFEPNVGTETVYVHSTIENGKAVRNGNPVGPSEQAKAIQAEVKKQAKALAMAMLPELLKEIQAGNGAKKEEVEETPEELEAPEPIEVSEEQVEAEESSKSAPKKTTTKAKSKK